MMARHQLYPNSVAVAASGCSTKQLQQWRQRGLLASIGRVNETSRAVYTRDDLIALRIVGELMRFGIPPQLAVFSANKLRMDLSKDFFAPESPRIILTIWNNVDDRGGAKFESFGWEAYRQDEFAKFLAGDAKVPSGSASILVPLTDLIAKVDEAIGRNVEGEAE